MKLIDAPEESEQRFRLLVEAVRDYAIYMLDPAGKITTWNIGAERIKGYRADEIIGKSFHLFFLPEDRATGVPDRILETAARDGHFVGEGWRVRKDGSRLWASVIVNAIRGEDGRLIGFAKITRDLTEHKQQADALKASEEKLHLEKNRLQLTLHSIADGVISTDAQERITLMNPAAEVMTGWSLDEARGRMLDEIAIFESPETRLRIGNPVRTCIAQKKVMQTRDGSVLVSRDGVQHDILDSSAPICMLDGEILGAVLVFQDVTHLRAALYEMEFSATHDALTLLPNRTLFRRRLEDALRRTKETGVEHAVCFLDLDRFKIINDTAGHTAGDTLLQVVGQYLARHVSEPHTVARLGGDEFAILFSGRTVSDVRGELQTLIEGLANITFAWEGRMFRTTASAGVAAATAETDAATVMKHADVACFAAKSAGRNRVSIYDAGRGEGFERHQELEIASDIKAAIVQDRFVLFAQNICAVAGPGHGSYEILLRMRGVDGEMLSPAQFIPAAERYDLMGEVDRWVLARVLVHYAAQLTTVDGIRVYINLSANSLNDATFLPFLLGLLKDSPLPPAALVFELTETALIANLVSASKVIEGIRGAGCRVALDDFGIGLSSFSYLRSFKVDYIKIEGSFVRNMANSNVDLAIVRAINNVAHEIDTCTIAEYVEDESIMLSLQHLGVDYAQGYALGRPAPIELIFH